MAFARGGTKQALRIPVEESSRALSANLRDAGGTFHKVRLSIRLRLGTDKHQSRDALRSATPKLQQQIAADGAAGKNGIRQFKMIKESQNIGGQLRHAEHGCVRNARKPTHGKVAAQVRLSVTAKVGNNGTNAAEVVEKWAPI